MADEASTPSTTRTRSGVNLMSTCSVCGDSVVAPDKGLGRAVIATWESRHGKNCNTAPVCPSCGRPMTDILAGTIACVPGGRQADVGKAYRCVDRTCQAKRDEAAFARAIARGVIDP